MGDCAGLVTHLEGEATGNHLVIAGRVRSIGTVGEEDADGLRLAGNQTVRHRAQAIETHVVLMDVGIVVVSHQEGVETSLTAMYILHVDVVVDGIRIADGGQFPLGVDGMDGVVSAV